LRRYVVDVLKARPLVGLSRWSILDPCILPNFVLSTLFAIAKRLPGESEGAIACFHFNGAFGGDPREAA
jgi:hypothetical protein